MPIPTPRTQEELADFIGRCMGDDVMLSEYPDEQQRAAVCHAAWRNASKERETMKLQYKHLIFQEFKSLEEDEPGTFEGYLSVFGNLDHDRDVVKAGAFKRTLREWRARKQMPAMHWLHQTDEPIGDWTAMEEDDTGLRVRGALWVRNPTEAVRKAHNVIRGKGPKGLSIGYTTRKWSQDKWTEDGLPYRILEDIDLYEGSIAPFAANERAMVTAAKSLCHGGIVAAPSEFEEVLRDAGLSRSQAKAFMAKGYSALREAVEPSRQMEALAESLRRLTAIIKTPIQ